MISHFVRLGVVALSVLCHAQLADAGFTSIYISPSAGSTIPVPDYDADPQAGILDVVETWTDRHGNQYGFEVWGTTDADPPLHITKEVTNGTGLTWIGYKLDLDPSDPHTFELSSPAPTSDTFTLTSSAPYSLEFGLPSPLPPGGTVTLDFVVNVVTTPTFSFTLTQMPIVPEPGTCVLLLLGVVLGAVRYRRRL